MTIVTIDVCEKALRDVTLSRRKNVAKEMSILLALLISEGISIESRKACAALYDAVDEDRSVSTGSSYRTIRWRVGAAVALCEKIGAEKIQKWIGAKRGASAISAIMDHVEEMKLYSIEAILDFSGKPAKPQVSPAPMPKSPPVPRWRVVDTPHLHIEIPDEATADELYIAAEKLSKAADRIKKAEK